jgi:putative endonuclease
MFQYVYILFSFKDEQFYTGTTRDLKRRVQEHIHGKNTSTRHRRPLKLIYYEAYLLNEDAEAREKYLKTNMGRRVIRKQLRYFIEKRLKKNPDLNMKRYNWYYCSS